MKGFKLILALLILTFTSCKPQKENELKGQDFIFTIEFYPSFIPSSRIVIQKEGEKETISIDKISGGRFLTQRENKTAEAIENSLLDRADARFYGDTLFVEHIESQGIDKKLFSQFTDSIASIDLTKQKSLNKENLTDGITVYFRYQTTTSDRRFSFRCPNKTDKTEQQIIKTLFDLIENSFKRTETNNYIENLKGYFDFGLLVKHISDKPLEYRFYGALTSNEETEFYTFMKRLPTKETIIFDMSNFEGMGTMYYPNFKELIVKNSNVYWIVSKQAQEHAQEIGVEADKIFTDRQTLMTKLKNEP